MKGIFLISVVLHLSVCYAYPGNQQGVGVYAYQDTAGNRYGGTYDLGPDAVGAESNFIGPFGNDFQDIDTFFPLYFRNFEKFLQQAFGSNIANQRLASNAAQRAFHLTTNRLQNFSPFFRFPPYGGFPNSIDTIQPQFGMPNFGANPASNSAFASSIAGPGLIQQVAEINPPSRKSQNVHVTRGSVPPGNNQFYSVSSSSQVSSSNIDGHASGTRKAETIVNDNGKITSYKVED